MIDFTLTLRELVRDATQCHDAALPGVPKGYDWAKRARIGAGNRPPAGWSAIQGWGQAFRQRGAVGAVEIRDMQTWVLTDEWRQVQAGDWIGAAFAPSYVDNEAVPIERDGDSVNWPQDRALHWWHEDRATLPAGLRAILVLCQARGPSGVLLGLGCDYWQNLDADWTGGGVANTDAAIGRVRRLCPQWRAYGMTTATTEQLAMMDRQ